MVGADIAIALARDMLEELEKEARDSNSIQSLAGSRGDGGFLDRRWMGGCSSATALAAASLGNRWGGRGSLDPAARAAGGCLSGRIERGCWLESRGTRQQVDFFFTAIGDLGEKISIFVRLTCGPHL